MEGRWRRRVEADDALGPLLKALSTHLHQRDRDPPLVLVSRSGGVGGCCGVVGEVWVADVGEHCCAFAGGRGGERSSEF